VTRYGAGSKATFLFERLFDEAYFRESFSRQQGIDKPFSKKVENFDGSTKRQAQASHLMHSGEKP
jgi:hypothetical protein